MEYERNTIMGETKRWIWPLGGVLVLLLTIWGWWGEGSASKLLPEPTHAPKAPTSFSQPVSSTGSLESLSLQKYDAAIHVRSQPLKDPFHGAAVTHRGHEEGALISKEEGAKGKEHSAPSTPIKETRRDQEQIKPSVDRLPKLQGVMSFGQKKRAVVEWNGSSYTVGEGEQVGLWTVSAINGKTVTLTAASGNVLLSTR